MDLGIPEQHTVILIVVFLKVYLFDKVSDCRSYRVKSTNVSSGEFEFSFPSTPSLPKWLVSSWGLVFLKPGA